MNHETRTTGVLIDRGFEADFDQQRMAELCHLFTDDDELQQCIYQIHLADNALDLKRGEFYPEILRAVLTLKHTLSALFQIDPVQVQPNFGSNGSIDTVLTAAALEGSRQNREALSRRSALATSPTYFRNYNSTRARGFKLDLVPLRKDFTFDAPAFIEEMVRLRPDVVFLVTPNNPTGIPIPDAEICSVLEALPENSWAIVDRTLVNIREEISTADLLRRYGHKNFVVLHSFSKYKGLSHLRIGVALYSNPPLAKTVEPYLPLGLGLESCLKAIRMVQQDQGIIADTRVKANITQAKVLLEEFVMSYPSFGVTDFAGNYCLLLLPPTLSSSVVTSSLGAEGIFVGDGHELPEPNDSVLRVHTGGPPEYVQQMCDTIVAKWMSGARR